MTLVSGSSARYCSTSAVLIIASLPTVASVLTPIARARRKPSTTLASAPLCSAMPTGPGVSGSGIVSANGAVRACALRKPRQFGPSRVTPWSRAQATRRSSSARPSGPALRNPDASTIALRTPAAPASCSTLSTASRRRHDERQVGGLGQVAQAGHGGPAERGGVPRVDRQQRPGEADRGAAQRHEPGPARGVGGTQIAIDCGAKNSLSRSAASRSVLGSLPPSGACCRRAAGWRTAGRGRRMPPSHRSRSCARLPLIRGDLGVRQDQEALSGQAVDDAGRDLVRR